VIQPQRRAAERTDEPSGSRGGFAPCGQHDLRKRRSPRRPEQRSEGWQALDVVPVEVRQHNMDARHLALKKFLAQGSKAAAAVNDDGLFFAGTANLQAGGIAAVAKPVRLRCRDGTAHSPEPQIHRELLFRSRDCYSLSRRQAFRLRRIASQACPHESQEQALIYYVRRMRTGA